MMINKRGLTQQQAPQLAELGVAIALDLVTGLKLTFASGDQVALTGRAVIGLTIVPARNATDPLALVGFDLRLALANLSSRTRQRLIATNDITGLTVVTVHQVTRYQVWWSPVTTDFRANANQVVEQAAGHLRLMAQWPRQFEWSAILPVALQTSHLTTMARALADGKAESLDYTTYLSRQLTTMQQMPTGAATASSLRVVARLVAGQVEWDPIIYEPTGDEHVFGGIEYLSYPEILAMPVQIATTGDFWAGMAALLWEISFYGIDPADRQAGRDELDAALAESRAFRADPAKLTQFLAQLKADPATIAEYQPLATGRVVDVDDWLPAGTTVLDQDPALMAAFQAEFGAQYAAFIPKTDDSAS